jgi:hypothetical protein
MDLAEAWKSMETRTPCEVRTETGWERTLITAIIANEGSIEVRLLDPHLMYWDGNEFCTRPGVRPPLPMQGYGAVEMAIESASMAMHLRVMPLQGKGS